MLPFGTYGNTDASTTRSPSTPRTRIDVGSTTAVSAGPIFAVPDRRLVRAHLRRARRVQPRLGIAGAPVDDLLGRLHARAGGELAVVVRRHRRLVQDVAGDRGRLGPLLAVVLGREVVEPQLGLAARVGGADLHGAAAVRGHRADVDLVAV